MSKQVEAAILALVNCWIEDGNVEHLHQSWIVLAEHVGRKTEAVEVSRYRTDDDVEVTP